MNGCLLLAGHSWPVVQQNFRGISHYSQIPADAVTASLVAASRAFLHFRELFLQALFDLLPYFLIGLLS